MRISDWSSDVCSSDLTGSPGRKGGSGTWSLSGGRFVRLSVSLISPLPLAGPDPTGLATAAMMFKAFITLFYECTRSVLICRPPTAAPASSQGLKIGRATCRGRRGQYVLVLLAAVP